MTMVGRFAAALLAVLALVLAAAPAAGAPGGGDVDGFTVGYLPAQVDERTTADEFDYAWGDVSFATRVWERPLEGGGFRVVLQVLVMRGERLTDLDAVRAFLAEYHERAPHAWELTPFDNRGTPGLFGEIEAFWSPEAGVAVEVRDTFGLLGEEELLATARGVGPTVAG
ncbi:hypothetical protein BJF83_08870 [Nocardiopsis sp. CNR-923]|uniref:hypothetical protein n=1 Tax=Nocardiopsis sp. CNR-923 TaxID=1904965 RepID=UPI0009658FB7|nr:hypothetical protein [Nocardiopsis sp. CNR-923]OLT30081.1 hypothetical protein BJF83_08870 [Nocardiopsis sp. CNR-923]